MLPRSGTHRGDPIRDKKAAGVVPLGSLPNRTDPIRSEEKESVVRQFLSDFRKFILRGNVLDLAVAVVVGTAFNAVVNSFARDIVLGFVAAIFGQPNFDEITIHLGDGRIGVGFFITSVVNFVII